MKKIYSVDSTGAYSDYGIHALFEQEGDAKEYVRRMNAKHVARYEAYALDERLPGSKAHWLSKIQELKDTDLLEGGYFIEEFWLMGPGEDPGVGNIPLDLDERE